MGSGGGLFCEGRHSHSGVSERCSSSVCIPDRNASTIVAMISEIFAGAVLTTPTTQSGPLPRRRSLSARPVRFRWSALGRWVIGAFVVATCI